MRAQPTKDGRGANSSAIQKQEQDPVERRRLQNRLSQRNHRRKIRDRIAKLQERVIASELRAAVTMNGWNYHHPGAPLSVPQIPPYDVDRKVLPPVAGNIPLMSGTYLPCSTDSCYPCNSEISPTPAIPPQTTSSFPQFESSTAKDADSSSSSSPSIFTNSGVCSPGISPVDLENGSSNYAAPDMNAQYQPEPWSIHAQCSGSNLYYVATEASLPHIMQMLENGPSKPKAIILFPQNVQPAGIPAPSTPQSATPSEQASATITFNPPGLMCQCHTRSFLSESPVDWMHPGTSTPCPLHPLPALDRYQQRMA
ncbi:hypothetical protein BBP40_010290 [Aspergillus hancockii]|nr:hypothetical protein BBP40_010290 [Aspergillus hancockii]